MLPSAREAVLTETPARRATSWSVGARPSTVGVTGALDRFAASIDVATLEFENLPLESVEYLEVRVAVRPNATALAVAQDRIKEKDFITAAGVATAPYRAVRGRAELTGAAADLGAPAVLKTVRLACSPGARRGFYSAGVAARLIPHARTGGVAPWRAPI